jgi:type IV secretion system protein VirD4
MTDEEMKGVLECVDVRKTEGTILGLKGKKAVCLPVDTMLNRNIAVYGASGSMKSRAFVRNMILQAVRRGGGESLIITDPKSEIFEDMAAYLSVNGYTVRVLNLIRPENSDSWNCLSEVRGDELNAQIFCDTIIKNTSTGYGDHFWDTSELNLLKALVLYVSLSCEKKNIGEVYNLLCNKTEAQLSALIDKLKPGHPAKAPYNIFKQAGDTVRGGIIIGLGSRLQVFQNEMIRKITSHDEIDLELPAREKCAYFCITSDQDSTFDFLSSLFFSFLFIRLVRYADASGDGGRCDVPVNFILDEFPNIGRIVDFKKKISTVRSRAIQISICFQNLGQLMNRYPDNEWQEILGNTDTQLALGCTDELTAKYLSDRTGEITIGVSSMSKTLSTWQVSDYTPQYRETSSVGRRKLMTMDEVLRMPLEKELVIIRGQKVLMLDKYDFTRHPESKKLIKCRASEYIPQWAADEATARASAVLKEDREHELPASSPADAEASSLDPSTLPPAPEAGKPKPTAAEKRPVRKYREK